MLTSKQIVLTALKHEESSKIPFDLGSTKMTGISMVAYKSYLHYANLMHLDDSPQMLDML